MLIGEISKRTGFSRDTLRWYEKIGLIQLKRNTRQENNYRSYDEALLHRLLAIKQMKSLGFTLKEIKELMFLEEIEELNCLSVGEIIQPKILDIEKKIAELERIKLQLTRLNECCKGDCKQAIENL